MFFLRVLRCFSYVGFSLVNSQVRHIITPNNFLCTFVIKTYNYFKKHISFGCSCYLCFTCMFFHICTLNQILIDISLLRNLTVLFSFKIHRLSFTFAPLHTYSIVTPCVQNKDDPMICESNDNCGIIYIVTSYIAKYF